MKKLDKDSAPRIEIFYANMNLHALAEEVGYGIEEEGLPSRIQLRDATSPKAYDLAQSSSLGVCIEVHQEYITLFSRLLKEKRPLLKYESTNPKVARIAGKNAARIIKNKPFIDVDWL